MLPSADNLILVQNREDERERTIQEGRRGRDGYVSDDRGNCCADNGASTAGEPPERSNFRSPVASCQKGNSPCLQPSEHEASFQKGHPPRTYDNIRQSSGLQARAEALLQENPFCSPHTQPCAAAVLTYPLTYTWVMLQERIPRGRQDSTGAAGHPPAPGT